MNLSKLLNKEERIDYAGLAEHHPAVIELYAENMRLHKKLEAAYVVASGEAVNWEEVGNKISNGVKKIWEMIKKVYKAIWDVVKKFGKAIANLAKKIWEQIKKVWRKFTGKGDKKNQKVPENVKREVLKAIENKDGHTSNNTSSNDKYRVIDDFETVLKMKFVSADILLTDTIISFSKRLREIAGVLQATVHLISEDKSKNSEYLSDRDSYTGDASFEKIYKMLKWEDENFNKYMLTMSKLGDIEKEIKETELERCTLVHDTTDGDVKYYIEYKKDIVYFSFYEARIEESLKIFESIRRNIEQFTQIIHEKSDNLIEKIESSFIKQEDKDFASQIQTDEDDVAFHNSKKRRIRKIIDDPAFKSYLDGHLSKCRQVYEIHSQTLHGLFLLEQLIIQSTKNISRAFGQLNS